MTRKFVCRTDQCPRDGMKAFDVEGGPRVLVANSGTEYFACQALCPHMEVPLEEGIYDGAAITCHRHMWQWDVRTGTPIGLAEVPLQRYDIMGEDGTLYVITRSAVWQTELFAGIAEPTLEAIERLARSQTFEAGSVIYKPGDPADDLCVLESGRVQFVVGRDDRTSPAGFSLRMGEVFGWAALLEDQPLRIARAACVEKSTVSLINGCELFKLLDDAPAAGYLVMRRLASLVTRHLMPVGAR
jgi:toluene monooxygenase system ferredoxin subunit